MRLRVKSLSSGVYKSEYIKEIKVLVQEEVFLVFMVLIVYPVNKVKNNKNVLKYRKTSWEFMYSMQ